jgi:hypothetical protein
MHSAPAEAARAPRSIWASAALTGNQLAIMATNLLLSLFLAAAGGTPAVGAVAPCLLVFQLGSGLLQQVVAEASLLAPGGMGRRLAGDVCRHAVAAAMFAGIAGAVLAMGLGSLVPGGNPALGIVFALGIPAVHGLDIGRAAAVASHVPRPAAIEAVAWAVTQAGAMAAGAAAGSPLAICAAWSITNWVFFLAAMAVPTRRPLATDLVAWLRSQRGFAAPAAADAILAGATPLLAVQLSAMVTSAATVGTVRILQQLFAPLSFISVSVRKVLIFRRDMDKPTTRGMAVRDGVIAATLVLLGAAMLAGALLVARTVIPALAFIPTGAAMVLAGVEKVAQGFSFGATLNKFLRRDFTTLLRARVLFLLISVVAIPLLCARYGAPGYLLASSTAIAIYSAAVLVSSSWRASTMPVPAAPAQAGTE